MGILSTDTLAAFLLVLFRMTGLMVSAPLFGDQPVPARVKVGFSLLMAVLVFPLLPSDTFRAPTIPAGYVLLIFREALVGLLVGFAARTLFAGIEMAGQVIAIKMGLALATTFDPISGAQSTTLANLYRWVALLVFLAVNGHHFLLAGMVESYRAFGFGEATFHVGVVRLLMRFLSDLFIISIQVSGPVVVVLFFTNVLLAILGRAMPQMHIFLVGLPVQMMLGFFLLAITLGGMVTLFPRLFLQLNENLEGLIRALAS
jgi:flagellar biosynthetic protein FliR